MKRKKGTKINIKNLIFNISVILFSLYMMAAGVCDLITVITWDSGGVIEYEGKYEVEVIRLKTRKNYVCKLGNGDEVIFSDRFNYDDYEELNFKYAKLISIVRLFAHRGVGVTTTNDVIIVPEESMKSEILNFGIIGIVLGSIFIFLLFLPVIFEKTISLIIWFHRPKKKKKKKR